MVKDAFSTSPLSLFLQEMIADAITQSIIMNESVSFSEILKPIRSKYKFKRNQNITLQQKELSALGR